MTKAAFTEWLQMKLSESDCHEEYGDMWRDIESQGLLPDGVTVAVDHLGGDFIFRLCDGLLASRFEAGIAGETLWYFVDDEAAGNLRDYSLGEVECALWRARGAVTDLEVMLTGRPGATVAATGPVWLGAAAYGDRDYGEGHSRLFARAYDHEPTEAEVRGDAFAEANPDWQQRYPGYTLYAASYEWEGSLEDALMIAIIPAADPPTTP